MQILLSISRSKDNQTMKFGQLIEYNMKIIFGKIKLFLLHDQKVKTKI